MKNLDKYCNIKLSITYDKNDRKDVFMLRYGMVGGGNGAFIGDVHRKAIGFDQKATLVAGCFSRNQQNNLESGKKLFIDSDRIYENFYQMAQQESKREDGIQFVVIVTPNYCHAEACRAFLNHGIHVVCEKPLATTLQDALELEQLATSKNLLFAVTYTFAGYPMIRYARELVQRGEIGNITMVMGEYPQDYLLADFDDSSLGKIPWRADPTLSGKTNCLGDIGSHIQFTTQYITGLEIDSVCAKLDCIGPVGTLDTNASVMLKFQNGATGMFWSSQVAMGNDNALRLRIYGDKGSIEWSNEKPEEFQLTLVGQPPMLIRKGHHYPNYDIFGRLPFGHTEGLYAAFANIYLDYCTALEAKLAQKDYQINFPTVCDGRKGVQFIESCLKSHQQQQTWIHL